MRKICLILTALGFAAIAFGQPTTSAYMKKIPSLPKDSCNIKRADAKNFSDQVGNLIDQVENDARALNKKARENAKSNEAVAKETAMQKLSQQYGVSSEDIGSIKNAKKMSAEDKQAFANKMMMQQTNTSMDEMKNLSKMSDAGKKAYAESYATETMAAGPPKKQAANENSTNIYQLLSKQQALADKIAAGNQKIAESYYIAENDPSGQEMLKRIETWKGKWNSMSGVDYGQGKQMDSLAALIKKEQISYCNRLTPLYRSSLRQHFSILKANLPDYRELGDIAAEISRSQIGVETPAETREAAGLEAIKEYLEKLKDAHRFTLYYPDK